MVLSRHGFDVPRALSAARVLVSNPDDLPQVFTIIEALSGNTLARTVKRCQSTESGRRLIQTQPDIVDTLADRAALARHPEGSLGRAYLDFVDSEGISAEGIRSASDQGERGVRNFPPSLQYMHKRMRDTHDLWHAVTGYKGDVLGELALLAFLFAQTGNPAVALITSIGVLKLGSSGEVRRVILDGYRRGKKAAWLPSQDWESMLALPVEQVRALLNVDSPPKYQPMRSAELRTQMAA